MKLEQYRGIDRKKKKRDRERCKEKRKEKYRGGR
jgi:hypothetical protein